MTNAFNNQNQSKGNAPTHIAYTVRGYGDGKSQWTRIGAVWPHKDGQGFGLTLEALPLDGRVEIRPYQEKKDSPEQAAA